MFWSGQTRCNRGDTRWQSRGGDGQNLSLCSACFAMICCFVIPEAGKRGAPQGVKISSNRQDRSTSECQGDEQQSIVCTAKCQRDEHEQSIACTAKCRGDELGGRGEERLHSTSHTQHDMML
jgi:hypothetical protein